MHFHTGYQPPHPQVQQTVDHLLRCPTHPRWHARHRCHLHPRVPTMARFS
jgi:hypothetical protein